MKHIVYDSKNQNDSKEYTIFSAKFVKFVSEFRLRVSLFLTLWPPGRLLTALTIFPRSAFDGFYLQMSLPMAIYYLLELTKWDKFL